MPSFNFINDFIDVSTGITLSAIINLIGVIFCSGVLSVVLYVLAKYAHVPYVGNFVFLLLIPKNILLWILVIYVALITLFIEFVKNKHWYKKYQIQYVAYCGLFLVMAVLMGFGCAGRDCVP